MGVWSAKLQPQEALQGKDWFLQKNNNKQRERGMGGGEGGDGWVTYKFKEA